MRAVCVTLISIIIIHNIITVTGIKCESAYAVLCLNVTNVT